MKIGIAILSCVVCSVGCGFGASFAQTATVRSHPRTVEMPTRARPQNFPGATVRAAPISPSGLLALSGTPPNGVYHRSSNPVALGRLAKPSGATPAVLAGARINRKP